MVGDREQFGSDQARDLIEDSIRRGLVAYRRGDFADAARALGEGLTRAENGMPDLWERLGEAYAETRDFERAIDVLERVVLAGRATVETYERLASGARELGRFADEVRYREAALDLRPESPSCWRDLGIARRHAGCPREAVSCFLEALRLDPQDRAAAGAELGRALHELGERERAVEAYRETLAREPERSDLWSELATLYSEMGRFAESDQAVREAIRLKPNNAAAWRTLATNTLKNGKRDTARKAYQRMTALNPDFAEEILSWVSNTAGLPPDDLAASTLAAAPARAPARRGRLLPFPPRG
jgi:tetratricopeptide (TPR) repeat protein